MRLLNGNLLYIHTGSLVRISIQDIILKNLGGQLLRTCMYKGKEIWGEGGSILKGRDSLLFCLLWFLQDVCVDGEGHLVSAEARQQQCPLLKHVWREESENYMYDTNSFSQVYVVHKQKWFVNNNFALWGCYGVYG